MPKVLGGSQGGRRFLMGDLDVEERLDVFEVRGVAEVIERLFES